MRKHDGDPANSRPSEVPSRIAPACPLPCAHAPKPVDGSCDDRATDRRPKVLATRLARPFVCLALANLVWWFVTTDARSLTIEELDSLSEQKQEDSILTILEYYYETVRKNNNATVSSECILEKNKILSESGKPNFISLVFLAINSARKDPTPPRTIEEIVAAVVDRECRT